MRVGVVAEAEGGVAAPDELAHLAAEGGAHTQVDGGVGVAEAPEARGERGAREGPHHGQGDRAAVRAAQRPHRLDPVSHGGEKGLRVGEKGASGFGEDGPAADALEERRAQLPLEEVDAPADRGLGQVEGGGGAGEAASPHDGHERLHVVELHDGHQHS